MALKLYERYPQLWESPSNDYPQGAFKNLSAQGETDGSYLEKDWLNDYSGFFGALLRNAEMTPDGTIDTAQRSQFYDALYSIVIRNLDDARININNDISALQKLIFDAVPVGVVKAYVGETAPNDKWLLCRGQAFSAESYPDLAQLLPDLKIPDLRGVALRGLDANRGFDPGRALLSYQEDAMQKIGGSFTARGLDIKDNNLIQNSSGVFEHFYAYGPVLATIISSKLNDPEYPARVIGFDSSKATRTNAQNETTMKNVAVNFIIKAR